MRPVATVEDVVVQQEWSSPINTAPSVLHSSWCCMPAPPEGAGPVKKRNPRCRCSSRSIYFYSMPRSMIWCFLQKFRSPDRVLNAVALGVWWRESMERPFGDELVRRQTATHPVLPSHGSGRGGWDDDEGRGGGEVNNRGSVDEARSGQIRQHR